MVSLDKLKNKYKIERKTFPQTPPLNFITEDKWGPTIYIKGRRYYQTPEGDFYPSVTTFLKMFEDTEWVAIWRSHVGDEKADKITAYACDRGELVHDNLDQYVTNNINFNFDNLGKHSNMFNQIRRRVDKHLSAVLYTEHSLYSKRLKIAGRVDLCGIWDGSLAIIDYKNKNRVSKLEDVESYFTQCATYAIMHYEQYKQLPEKLVVLAAVENDNIRECQVFVQNTKDWAQKVIEMTRRFHVEALDWYDIEGLDFTTEKP
jgi:hypothetical protein